MRLHAQSIAEFQPVVLIDGPVQLAGQLIVPDGSGPFPAVLVMPSAMGMGPHYFEIARRLAEQGFAALLADMYGAGAAFARPEDVGEAHGALLGDPELVVRRSIAWFDALRDHEEVQSDRVAAIGYCFGGKCVLEIARSGAEVRAVVSFHGTLTTEHAAAPGAIKGLVAVYTGGRDPFAPPEDVAAFENEMREAEARWHLTLFSHSYHSFTTVEDGALPIPGLAYDPLADAVSWAGTLALLNRLLADGRHDMSEEISR